MRIYGSCDIENSNLEFVNKSGSGDLIESVLKNKNLSGSTDIRGKK